MSLDSGFQIDGRAIAELPMTTDVIHHVEELFCTQNQPFRMSKMIKLE